MPLTREIGINTRGIPAIAFTDNDAEAFSQAIDTQNLVTVDTLLQPHINRLA